MYIRLWCLAIDTRSMPNSLSRVCPLSVFHFRGFLSYRCYWLSARHRKEKKRVRPSGEYNADALRRTYWQTLADNYARTRDLHPHRHRDPHIYSDTHEIACSQLINTFPQWKNRPVGYKSCFEFVDHLTEGKKREIGVDLRRSRLMRITAKTVFRGFSFSVLWYYDL